MTPTWVIGSGGLIGRSIVAASDNPWNHGEIPWHDQQQARAELARQAQEFARVAGVGPWSIAWAAGAATVGTAAQALGEQTRTLEYFLDDLAQALPRGPGSFLLASSAGGVYAGSTEPPFDESSEPRPISEYGEQKLRQEQLVAGALGSACGVVLARFSNVYGPDQNLAKAQGLISQLALAAVTRQPLNVYVPLETVRDYVFAADAGAAARHWLDDARASQQHHVRVIASGQGTSVASLIGTVSDIVRRRIPIALGTSANASAQALDLRMRPSEPQGRPFPRTPLVVGMKQVVEAVLRHQQQGERAQTG